MSVIVSESVVCVYICVYLSSPLSLNTPVFSVFQFTYGFRISICTMSVCICVQKQSVFICASHIYAFVYNMM